MIKFYAKQIDPEWQEDGLFYQYKDKNTGKYKLGLNDDFYGENVIIYGNKEYLDYTNEEFERLLDFENSYYEFGNSCYWKNDSEFINWYLKRKNGKKYSPKEIHKWKELFKKYEERYRLEDIVCDALELMTGKKWRSIKMCGCLQREWQYGYANEKLTKMDVNYIEMCYFNTGSEYIVYESEEDFENEENGCSYYIDSYDSKQNLSEILGCEESELEMYQFSGYQKVPQYKKA